MITTEELAKKMLDAFCEEEKVEVAIPDYIMSNTSLGVAMEYLGLLKDARYQTYIRTRSGLDGSQALKHLSPEDKEVVLNHIGNQTFITTRAVFEAVDELQNNSSTEQKT